jgi:hypothetical protein
MNAKPVLVCLLALLATCGPLPSEPELRFAATTSACGPDSRSFTAILLTPDPIDFPGPYAPYLRVVLPEERIMLGSRSWTVGYDEGLVAEYVGSYTTESASRGQVNVTWVDGNLGAVEGSLDLEFTSLTAATKFKAPWVTLTSVSCR